MTIERVAGLIGIQVSMSQQEKLLISPCKSSVRIEMDGRMTLVSPDDADALAEMLQVAADVARDNASAAETAQK